MANFFDNIKKNFDKGTKVIGAKSNELIETNKIKSELNALKKSKEETFKEIGRKVYEYGETFSLETVAEEMESIKNYEETIADRQADMDRIKEETESKLNSINEPVVESELEDAVEVAVEDVTETASDVVEDVQDFGEKNLENVQDLGEGAVDEVKDLASDASDEIKNTFNEFKGE